MADLSKFFAAGAGGIQFAKYDPATGKLSEITDFPPKPQLPSWHARWVKLHYRPTTIRSQYRLLMKSMKSNN